MLNKLRPRMKRYIDPAAKKIAINPNIITIIGLLVSLVAAYQLSQGDLLGGALLILLSGFFDVVDGAVARNHGRRTKFGGILDSTVDRFADAFIIIGVIAGGYVNWIWGVLALHASLSVSYVRARAEVDGVKCDVGVAERAERLMILVLGAFLAYFLKTDLIMTLAVLVVLILGYFTVAQRLYHSYRQLN
ncbi:MAG TPA: archaetidylinositol phosphate synthase [Methanobacteriaceae archaeon]|nr:archaetidylinositol phosphate synthase [Euryarchaeota archaeon]HNR25250.1 archaetidylinositol phosphate synthase [Methanobacteriaceae archaeon]